MAILRTEDGNEVYDFDEIVEVLELLGVTLGRCQPSDDVELAGLLSKNLLTSYEQGRVVEKLGSTVDTVQAQMDCTGHDLVVLHPTLENFDELLAKFARCHVHPDDEVRYVIDGEGVFGVVLPDGTQAELTVVAPEFVRVPKGLEHWFRLTKERRIKCVRYFSETVGWEASFTGTEVRMD